MLRWLLNRPRQVPRCEHCGYDLSGISRESAIVTCPECGEETTASLRTEPPEPLPGWLLALRMTLPLAFSLAILGLVSLVSVLVSGSMGSRFRVLAFWGVVVGAWLLGPLAFIDPAPRRPDGRPRRPLELWGLCLASWIAGLALIAAFARLLVWR